MPRYGFNVQWMFSFGGNPPAPPDEKALDFMAAQGFDFVRLPTDYRFWTQGVDYLHPDERVLEALDGYLDACQRRGIHLSLNLHRAPGYCINGNHQETHNLWLDSVAKDAFAFLWETFARRYRGVPSAALSFDLLNEPPEIGQYGLTRENHEALMRRVVRAVRAVDPGREIVIDGLGGGHLALPELADLGAIHSARGYQPMALSHYRAGWWEGHQGLALPVYPGLTWNGRTWDREALRDFYQPWLEVRARGVTIHVGECGCYNQTPQPVALRWLRDLLGLYRELGWGFAFWNFQGAFGIIDHGREGARFESMNGYRVDRELLDLILESRLPREMNAQVTS